MPSSTRICLWMYSARASAQLDAQAVQVEVVAVAVLGEPLAGDLADAAADGDDRHGDHVELAAGPRPPEVRQAPVRVSCPGAGREADELAAWSSGRSTRGRRGRRRSGVAVGLAGPVAVDGLRLQDALALAAGDEVAVDRADLARRCSGRNSLGGGPSCGTPTGPGRA